MPEGNAEVLARKLKLNEVEVAGERVLVRADLNVPVLDGTVTDDTRIAALLPTLEWLVDEGAAVVLMSHRGRPRGAPDPPLSMAPVAEALQRALDRGAGARVALLSDCIGAEVERRIESLEAGEVALLENLRFHAGEEANDRRFASALAALAPIYVDDAFGTAHRAHASVVGVPSIVEPAAAGLLLEREVVTLSKVLEEPARPFVLLMGGAKVSDKLEVLENLLPRVDRLIVGGAMANALLAARGVAVGGSRVEEGSLDSATRVLEKVQANGVELFLPGDFVVASGLERAAEAFESAVVPAGAMVLDIGAATRDRFVVALADAQTVLWNGPMGVFETPPCDAGTHAVAEAIAGLGDAALTVLGGGDTAAAAAACGISSAVTHVSTGGGASLDLLSGKVLPGVAALTDRDKWFEQEAADG